MWLSFAVPEWKHQSYFHPLFLELVTESTSSPLGKKKKQTETVLHCTVNNTEFS